MQIINKYIVRQIEIFFIHLREQRSGFTIVMTFPYICLQVGSSGCVSALLLLNSYLLVQQTPTLSHTATGDCSLSSALVMFCELKGLSYQNQ